jgi:hypothetical protein
MDAKNATSNRRTEPVELPLPAFICIPQNPDANCTKANIFPAVRQRLPAKLDRKDEARFR